MTSRDYSSFSAAAKVRFRGMADRLNYEQITGVVYVRARDGWYELLSLQASSWANPFFYINYGVIYPGHFPLSRDELKGHSWQMEQRLHHPGGAFPCASKAEIAESAAHAEEEFKRTAAPWFESLNFEVIKRTCRPQGAESA